LETSRFGKLVGQLWVASRSHVLIHLIADERPRSINVFFKNHPTPCDPHHHHHHDHLKAKVEEIGHHHNHRKEYYLYIEWDVRKIREVEYEVFY
jgi:hypothetical protein